MGFAGRTRRGAATGVDRCCSGGSAGDAREATHDTSLIGVCRSTRNAAQAANVQFVVAR